MHVSSGMPFLCAYSYTGTLSVDAHIKNESLRRQIKHEITYLSPPWQDPALPVKRKTNEFTKN